MRKRRGAENLDDMPTRYTDIAVVTSPRIMVTEEIDVEIEEVEELKPFIEGSFCVCFVNFFLNYALLKDELYQPRIFSLRTKN